MSRGFGSYTFLTLDKRPRILCAKLAAGFPHIAIAVPASAVEATTYSLCRFNVAMTRYLRRDGKPGFTESGTNGRYYDDHQIPVARTVSDKHAMLREHLPHTMIEVLIHGDLALPHETIVCCYSASDERLAQHVLVETRSSWTIQLAEPPGKYPRNQKYANAVEDFIDRALRDPGWLGNGLEFDSI